MKSIMKISKEKLNELFYFISLDSTLNSIVYKITYIYARHFLEVVNIQLKDINLASEEITFHMINDGGDLTLKIHKDIITELTDYIMLHNFKEDDFLFRKKTDTNPNVVKRFNNYLSTFISRMNKKEQHNYPKLTNADLRILRGQHLLLDGVGLDVVKKFMINISPSTVRTYLNKDKFYPPAVKDTNDILDACTDLNLYIDETYDSVRLFSVNNLKDSTVVELNVEEGKLIALEPDSKLNNIITAIGEDYIVEELMNIKEPGQYKLIEDLRFLLN